MSWYICRSATRREKRAVVALKEIGVHAYCPKITRWERIGRRQFRDKREHPLFPGYLFAQIPDGFFAAVEAADGVSGVLRTMGASGEYTPRTIEGEAVSALFQAEMAGEFDKTRQPEAKDGLQPGQSVKVLVGAWWGHIATIKGLDSKGRIAVLHSLFGRQSEASYDPKQLELVA